MAPHCPEVSRVGSEYAVARPRLLFSPIASTISTRRLSRSCSLERPLDKIPTEAGEVNLVYLPRLHRAEKALAQQLKKLLAQPARQLPANYDEALAQIESVLDLELNAEQRHAVKRALTCPVSVLTGKPGTGKTTSVRVLVSLAQKLGLHLRLAAPTGRAASPTFAVGNFFERNWTSMSV